MSFLEKLQKKPRYVRLIILWTVVAVTAAVLLFFWTLKIRKSFIEIKEKDINIFNVEENSFSTEIEVPKEEIEKRIKGLEKLKEMIEKQELENNNDEDFEEFLKALEDNYLKEEEI